MLKRLLVSLVVLLGLAQLWDRYTHRALVRPDGVLVADAPVQTAVGDANTFARGAFTLRPLAAFALHGRVLLVSRYRLDREAALAPYDLGIGWQRMSDSAVLRQLDLSQSARFLHWRWRDAPPIPEAEITGSAANIHLIPATRAIAARIAALRPGQLVALRGQLVEAALPDGWHWRSSLSRTDSGAGACELLYVEDLEEDRGAG